jgi:ribonuclease VapC
MVAVDTSALIAIVLNETAAEACGACLQGETDGRISAGSMAEALIVAGRRSLAARIERLVDGLGFTVVPVTPAAARRVAAA